MKTTFKLLLLVFPILSFAQQVSVGNYMWQNRILMQQCTVTGDTTSLPIDKSEFGQRFYILKKIKKGKWLVQVADYVNKNGRVDPKYFIYNKKVANKPAAFEKRGTKEVKVNYFKADFTESADVFYLVDESAITASAVRQDYVGTSLALGVLSLPFKFRPQGAKDFSGAINIGAGIGCTLPHIETSDWRFLLLAGLSIGSDKIELKNIGTDNVTSNIALYSGSLGAMAQYKKVQVGLFVGTDYISRQDYQNTGWEYRGKPWISIGFGLSLFTIDSKKTTTVADEKQDPGLLGQGG